MEIGETEKIEEVQPVEDPFRREVETPSKVPDVVPAEWETVPA